MLQRGRKSATKLAVVTPFQRVERLKQPENLTKSEAELFVATVSACSADHFVQSDANLLVAYCQAVLLTRWAFKQLGEDAAAFSTWQQAARTMAMLATKLRLCPHSRSDPKTITRRAPGVGVSVDAYLSRASDAQD